VKNPECQVSEIRNVRVSSFFIGKKEDEVPRFYINFRNPVRSQRIRPKETKAPAIASAPEILADNAKYVSDHLLKAVITNNIFSAASFIGLGARGVVEPIT
jgi:hypothetical protein